MDTIYRYILGFCFLSLPVGLFYGGVRSIYEGLFTHYGPQGFKLSGDDKAVIMTGIFFTVLSLGLFSMYASFYSYVFCEDLNTATCSLSHLIKTPFDSLK